MHQQAVLRAWSDRADGASRHPLQRGPAVRGHERGVPADRAHLRGQECVPESGEGPQELGRLLPAAAAERVASVRGGADGQTDRQTDRQRQAGRQTDRQTVFLQTEHFMCLDRQTDRRTDRQTNRWMHTD